MSMSSQLQSLKKVLDSAAAIVRTCYEERSSVSYKQDGSPLTRADTETNQYLKESLSELHPDAGWLSEESDDDRRRLEREWVWVVDPVDGTKEFVSQIPEIAISVGLVHRGAVTLAGIVNPVTGEGGVSSQDESQFWGFDRAQRVPPSQLAQAVASVSRSEIRDGVIDPYQRHIGTIQPVGSVAYKLLRVAAGHDDFTFSVRPKSEWDICGGVGLLRSVGMSYQRLDGEPSTFNQPDPLITCGAVAGPRALVDEFLSIARTRGRS